MPNSGAGEAANSIYDTIMAGVGTVDLPIVDLSEDQFQPDGTALSVDIERLTNKDLTEEKIGGEGTFDALIGYAVYLRQEFDKNRITGEQYAKAFIALSEGAMSQAVQYLLGRDQAYWQAVTAQQNALTAQAQTITARVQLEAAKVQLASLQIENLKTRAEYALTKIKLATEDMNYGAAAFQLENILPQQEALLKEQVEAARAQTLNTRTDGTAVAGSVGKQNALYDQQITSYKRDSEVKAAKIFIDAWTAAKTIDEGLLPPQEFINQTLDQILLTLKETNNLNFRLRKMGFFGGSTTYVASTLYNMAGEPLERPNYLKTTVIGAALVPSRDGMSSSITDSYLKGPALKLRSFFRWAEDNYDGIGVPTGTIGGSGSIDPDVVETAIPVEVGETVNLDRVESGIADFSNWTEQYLFENNPTAIGTNYTTDISEAGVISIIYEDGSVATFTPDNFDTEGVYIYASYTSHVRRSSGDGRYEDLDLQDGQWQR